MAEGTKCSSSCRSVYARTAPSSPALGQEAPLPEDERPQAEEQSLTHGSCVEEQDERAGLDREEREGLQRVVQVAEALALSALHGELKRAPCQRSRPAIRS
jgi:hypothetical protein